MSPNLRPTCKVCRKQIGECEQYLVRIDGPRMTAVHRSLCFPPSYARVNRRPAVGEASSSSAMRLALGAPAIGSA